jgi:putative ABC transport system ATP-binding protein
MERTANCEDEIDDEEGNVLLTLKDVSKSVDQDGRKIRALKKINFKVRNGDFISVLDPDQMEKDALFTVMGCIEPPDSGAIFFNKKNVTGLPDDKLRILRLCHMGLVFKKSLFMEDYTVLENIELLLREARVPKEETRERALSALKRVGMEDKADVHPGDLSFSEQKAVAIARALANCPNLLIVNEPPPEPNPEGKTTSDLLKGLHDEEGMTVVYLTSDEGMANMASTVYTIEKGVLKRKR